MALATAGWRTTLAGMALCALAGTALADNRVVPTGAQINQWVTRYAPVVYFHSDEHFFPTSAESFLAIASPAGDGLALRDTSDTAKAGNLNTARAYANVKIDITTTEIQYWYLYAYNGAGTAYWKYLKPVDFSNPLNSGRYDAIGDYQMDPCGQHEGDWEHIAVRVDNVTGNLVAGYLSQHDGGAWFPASQVNMAGGRVTFYASKNGHAAYWQPGRDYGHFVSAYAIEFRLLNDTNGAGRRLDSRANGGPVLIGLYVKQGSGSRSPGAGAVTSNIFVKPGAGSPGAGTPASSPTPPPPPPPPTSAPQTQRMITNMTPEQAAAKLGLVLPPITVVPASWMSVKGRWGRVYERGPAKAQAELEGTFGKVGGTLVSLGLVKLADIIMDKAGLKDECEEEAGPMPPWSKDSWIGPDT